MSEETNVIAALVRAVIRLAEAIEVNNEILIDNHMKKDLNSEERELDS